MRRSPDSGAFDVAQFATRIRSKRGRKGLRPTAAEIGGVTASTLSRLEQGGIPDLDTLIRVCHWLEASPNDFIPGFREIRPEAETQDLVEAQFRADKILSPDAAEALSAAVRALYSAAVRGEL